MTDLDDQVRAVPLDHAGRPAAWMVRILLSVMWPLMRLFHRPTITGLEHLPTRGPFLLVANHSAGLGLAELMSFAALYVRMVGPERPLAGFAHPTTFRLWPTSVLQPALGAIPSTYAAAEQTLARGVPLLVFPGGNHETLRPIWQANRVDLGGRMGFLRIARKARVPIVPMGIRGSHYTAPMLVRSRALASLLILPRWVMGSSRWAITLLGVLGAAPIAALPLSLPVRLFLAWLWLGSPLVMLPIVPWSIRFRVGVPITSGSLFGDGEGEDDAQLEAALARVQAELQRLVDR